MVVFLTVELLRTYRVDYTAPDHGDHVIKVTLDEKHVDRSPYRVSFVLFLFLCLKKIDSLLFR